MQGTHMSEACSIDRLPGLLPLVMAPSPADPAAAPWFNGGMTPALKGLYSTD